jgi:AraC-like DNA-binding protein
LEIAEKLLRTTDESVKKIAITSGFEEVEYFSRCFKKYYGMTPTKYRAQYLKVD